MTYIFDKKILQPLVAANSKIDLDKKPFEMFLLYYGTKTQNYNELKIKLGEEKINEYLKNQLTAGEQANNGGKIKEIVNSDNLCIELISDVIKATGYQITLFDFIRSLDTKKQGKRETFYRLLPEKISLTGEKYSGDELINLNPQRLKNLCKIDFIKKWLKGEIDEQENKELNEIFNCQLEAGLGYPLTLNNPREIMDSITALNYNVKKSKNGKNVLFFLIDEIWEKARKATEGGQMAFGFTNSLSLEKLTKTIVDKKGWKISNGKENISEKYSQLLNFIDKNLEMMNDKANLSSFVLKIENDHFHRVKKKCELIRVKSEIDCNINKKTKKKTNKI